MKLRLKELRESAGLKQADLAKAIGVASNTISTWEQGQREPNCNTLVKIAAYFGVTTDYLLGKDTAEKPTFPKPEPPQFAKEEVRLIDKYRQLTIKNKARLDDLLSTFLRAQSAPALAGA